jgi:uncharacterized membrane protein
MNNIPYLILEIVAYAGSIALFVGLFWAYRHEWKSTFVKIKLIPKKLAAAFFKVMLVSLLLFVNVLFFLEWFKTSFQKIRDRVSLFLKTKPITANLIIGAVLCTVPKFTRLLYVFI